MQFQSSRNNTSGEGIGLEDNLFMTNEEWMNYDDGSLSLESVPMLSTLRVSPLMLLAFSMGVSLKRMSNSTQNADYVMFGMSGYNGDFSW
jgi:hypothetical protein